MLNFPGHVDGDVECVSCQHEPCGAESEQKVPARVLGDLRIWWHVRVARWQQGLKEARAEVDCDDHHADHHEHDDDLRHEVLHLCDAVPVSNLRRVVYAKGV